MFQSGDRINVNKYCRLIFLKYLPKHKLALCKDSQGRKWTVDKETLKKIPLFYEGGLFDCVEKN